MTTTAQTDHKPDRVYPWNTGMPTKPDVDALMRHWPEPKVGDIMTYDEITAVTGSVWKTDRFKSITTSWRHRMQELGFVMECKAGECFYVASADQISAKTYDEIAGIGRKARRHRKKLATAPVENDLQRAIRDHQIFVMHAIESDTKRKRMNILPSTVAAPMPRIGPPTDAPGPAPTSADANPAAQLKTA